MLYMSTSMKKTSTMNAGIAQRTRDAADPLSIRSAKGSVMIVV